MAKIVFNWKKCDEGCCKLRKERTPMSGYAEDYFCDASGGRKICGYVEWDRDVPPIPDWCPNMEK